MPISKVQKAKTRERIIQCAATLFRRNGFHGVGIESIMHAARLTRGGFYAHFRSKQALLAEVISLDFGLQKMLRERVGPSPRQLRAQAKKIIGDYLNPRHQAEVAEGCSLSSLAFDTARADRAARRAYADKIAALADEFVRGRHDIDARDPRVLRAIVLTIGGLSIARAIGTTGLGAAFAAACRDAVFEFFDAV